MSGPVSTVRLDPGPSLEVASRGDPDGPALVLLPGPTDTWRSYEAVLDHLAPSVCAFAVSQRGHGASDAPEAGFGIADFAADVVPLLDALGVERAVLAGHSGSCLTARRVAIDAPDRVAGLVLEASPTTLRGDPRLQAFVEGVVGGISDPIDPSAARELVLTTSSPDLDPAVVDALVAELLTVPARVWHEVFGDLLRYDDTEALGAIRCPVLLVWGDADGLIPRAAQDELLRRLPGAELVVHSGVGHTPRWEHPERFADEVAAFVLRVDGAVGA